MFKGIIARRVKAAMEQKIKDAEATYRMASMSLYEEADEKIKEITYRVQDDCRVMEDKLVNDIIGSK